MSPRILQRIAPQLVLLLTCCCQWSSQEPIFYQPPQFAVNTAPFKGLPALVKVNETADETRSVYYHDQVVAVVDVVAGKKLIRCELVEVYETYEADEVLRNLSATYQPQRVSFKDIMKLMDRCDKLDEHPARALALSQITTEKSQQGNPLFAGIVPGTKWCGTGDIAKSYSDLGQRTRIDRCCRAHDLCPVKVRAYKNRYNLVNNSFFSKSHCTCDDIFYSCLKSVNHVSASIIGHIYFNIAQPPCIEDTPADISEESTKKFVPVKKQF